MIHADALDFSEWHSEEVISFFWRSVYKYDLWVTAQPMRKIKDMQNQKTTNKTT